MIQSLWYERQKQTFSALFLRLSLACGSKPLLFIIWSSLEGRKEVPSIWRTRCFFTMIRRRIQGKSTCYIPPTTRWQQLLKQRHISHFMNHLSQRNKHGGMRSTTISQHDITKMHVNIPKSWTAGTFVRAFAPNAAAVVKDVKNVALPAVTIKCFIRSLLSLRCFAALKFQ